MANTYKKRIESAATNSMISTGLSWATTGASIGGGLLSGWGGLIGGIAGLLGGMWFGWESGKNQARQEIRDLATEAQNDRMEATDIRNQNIQDAQRFISRTRDKFDTTYGAGMYDQYDELFQTIFNLPAGTQTVSDLLESLSTDSISGSITTSADSSLIGSSISDTLSLSDINAGYLDYMRQQIHTADTILGMRFRYNTERENQMIDSYLDSVEQYNLQLAQQFDSAFLQRRMEQASEAMAMGETAVAQANSGFRQTGSGTNLTAIQQFQNDMAEVAYSSMVSYQLRGYQLSMERSNTELVNEVYSIRTENAMTTQEALEGSIEGYNAAMDEAWKYQGAIDEGEEEIEEYNTNLDEMYEALGDKSDHRQKMDVEPEEAL